MLRREGMQSDAVGSAHATPGVVREKSWVALLLAWVAAFSDAINYRFCCQTVTSNIMSSYAQLLAKSVSF
jgi:hypothetical protein